MPSSSRQESSDSSPPSSGPTADLRVATMDALRPTTLGLAVVFGLFIVFNLIDLPENAVAPVVAHDAFMVLFSAAVWQLTVRGRITLDWVNPIALVLTLLVSSNILLTTWLLRDPFHTQYIAIVVTAAGAMVLSTRWAVGTMGLVMGAWAPVVWVTTTPRLFTHHGCTLLAAAMVALAIHFARRHTHLRLAEMQRRNMVRQVELKHALDAAEQARKELNSKVEERTLELSCTTEELRAELEERRRIESERRKLEDALQHAKRMEAIGRLAGGVAHDFNNQLTVISGTLEFLLSRDNHPRAIEEALQDAVDASTRAAEVTQQLLSFSRRQILDLRVTSLATVIEPMRKILDRVVGEQIGLDLELDPVDNVLVDPRQIEQLLMNLVVNACDAMPDGGTLSISLHQRTLSEADARIKGGAKHGDYAVIDVRDSGRGMDEKTARAVFEPFFTTKKLGQGTGLGLAIVDGVVRQHEGFVDVISAIDEGTTFSVYLPCHLESSRKEPEEQARLDGGTETLLIVEDNPAVGRVAARVLEARGYTVLSADTAAGAMELAKSHERSIDLLVTDVILADMDGRELVTGLGTEQPGMGVLFVSGHSEERIADRGVFEDGANFLSKPYHTNDLARKVRAVLDARATDETGDRPR